MNNSSPQSDASLVPSEWGLLDAQAQHESFPDSFPIPGLDERTSLRAGDMVKLVFVIDPPPESGPNAERMWVEVKNTTEGGSYEGWLTNRPVVIPDLEPSAIVAFSPQHVAGIALQEEEVSFDVELKAVVSAPAVDGAEPPGWAGFEEPLDATDSGWVVTAGDEDADFFDDSEKNLQAVRLGELAQRFPALVEVFQAGEGEWVYRPDHRRYVRVKNT